MSAAVLPLPSLADLWDSFVKAQLPFAGPTTPAQLARARVLFYAGAQGMIFAISNAVDNDPEGTYLRALQTELDDVLRPLRDGVVYS